MGASDGPRTNIKYIAETGSVPLAHDAYSCQVHKLRVKPKARGEQQAADKTVKVPLFSTTCRLTRPVQPVSDTAMRPTMSSKSPYQTETRHAYPFFSNHADMVHDFVSNRYTLMRARVRRA
ncbi:unnamed protein product [Sphacelaria rigidula]